MGYGILADDEHPHLGQRLAEGAQDVGTGWQVATASGDLSAEKLAELGDPAFDWPEGLSPVRSHKFAQGACRHVSQL